MSKELKTEFTKVNESFSDAEHGGKARFLGARAGCPLIAPYPSLLSGYRRTGRGTAASIPGASGKNAP